MKLNTHIPTPAPKYEKNKALKLLIAAGAALFYGIFILCAYVCMVYRHSPAIGIVVLAAPVFFGVIVFVREKDIEKAYVEICGDSVRVVDYCFGVEKEKVFLRSDITSVEIAISFSHKVKGSRMNNVSYLVFRKQGQYLFKMICLPNTKEIWKAYLNNPDLLQ